MSSESAEGPRELREQLQQIEQELRQAREALAQEMVEVTTGGGAVRVKMSGTQECHQVMLDPDLVAAADVEKLQALLLLAINQAIHESQVVAARRLGPLASAAGTGSRP